MRFIEGLVHNGRIGVLVELALETQFTAAMPEFKQLAKDLALQVAAAPVADMQTLLEQPLVKDSSRTVSQLVAETSHMLGEEIAVIKFVRWDAEACDPLAPEPPPAAEARLRRV